MTEITDNTQQRLGHKFGLAPGPHELVARTYALTFARTDVGSFSSKFNEFFLHRQNSPEIALDQAKSHGSTLGVAQTGSPFRKYSDIVVVGPIVTLGSPRQVKIFRELAPVEPRIEISPDAQRRLSTHASLAGKVYSVIKEEARRADVLPSIVVRPSWSHEFEDRTGVVIEVEIKGDSEKRFDLWDAISSKLDVLLDSISAEDRSFLADNLSVVVTQSE